MKSELVKPTHLARKAVVYIRQSTPHQVVSNQESLRLQYALRQRARELGWHEADIDVIDADLGLSGASAAQRSGFNELVGRVGLSEIGLILSIDVTRLARNCSDLRSSALVAHVHLVPASRAPGDAVQQKIAVARRASGFGAHVFLVPIVGHLRSAWLPHRRSRRRL
jgi:Resolvase, N terminal domain